MQQPCGLICHYYSLLSLSIQLTEVRVVYRGATIMSGLLPKDREAGESRNLTSAWSRLESSALPFSNYGNLGNLLTYLSLNVINWKIRTPSPILGSCWHSIIKPQLWHFCTKVWALQALSHQAPATNLWGAPCYSPYFTQEETEAQRRNVPKSSQVTNHWVEIPTCHPTLGLVNSNSDR